MGLLLAVFCHSSCSSSMDEASLPRPMVRCPAKTEAAEYLGIGITLFDELRIPAVRFGRRCLYDRVDLDAWLDDYKQRGRAGKEVEWPVKPGSTADRLSLLVDCNNASERRAHTPKHWD